MIFDLLRNFKTISAFSSPVATKPIKVATGSIIFLEATQNMSKPNKLITEVPSYV